MPRRLVFIVGLGIGARLLHDKHRDPDFQDFI